jgi:hypothetical protein
MEVHTLRRKYRKPMLARESKRRRDRKFAVGDKVKVIGMAPVTFAPGIKDEIGTEKLFKSMLGNVYTVQGFDKYGNVELHPKRLDWVWIEPEFLKLRVGKKKTR